MKGAREKNIIVQDDSIFIVLEHVMMVIFQKGAKIGENQGGLEVPVLLFFTSVVVT